MTVNSHGTRRLYPSRNEMAVYCQDIYFGVLRCLCVKSDMNYVILVPKKFASWSKKCHFRSISGSFPVKFPPKNFFLEKFYCTKRFVFEFQGESLGLFFSYRAPFRRYQHFRRFWQSTASSFRDC